MFTTGETYHDLGGDYYARPHPERATKRLVPNSKRSDTTSPSNRCLNPDAFPIRVRCRQSDDLGDKVEGLVRLAIVSTTLLRPAGS